VRTRGFDQLMMIYADGDALRADYVSSEGYKIHYTRAAVTPGKAVTFVSRPGAGPVFQLTYELRSPGTVAVMFGTNPPGQTAFHPIATGTLKKSGN
jgi:hypothetical protein